MSGMDRLTDEALVDNIMALKGYQGDDFGDDLVSRLEVLSILSRSAEQAAHAPSDGLREAAQWANAAMVAIRGYERDLGVPMDDECEIGRIDDSRDSPSFRIRVGHIRRIAQALTPAPAQEGASDGAIRHS